MKDDHRVLVLLVGPITLQSIHYISPVISVEKQRCAIERCSPSPALTDLVRKHKLKGFVLFSRGPVYFCVTFCFKLKLHITLPTCFSLGNKVWIKKKKIWGNSSQTGCFYVPSWEQRINWTYTSEGLRGHEFIIRWRNLVFCQKCTLW